MWTKTGTEEGATLSLFQDLAVQGVEVLQRCLDPGLVLKMLHFDGLNDIPHVMLQVSSVVSSAGGSGLQLI